MKKLAFILSFALLAFTSVSAQSNLKPLLSNSTAVKLVPGLDTGTNSASITQVIKIQGWQNMVTIQTAVTKLTGNPTLGSVKIFGSIDSAKWDNIPVGITSTGTIVTTVNDTLAVTNVTTPQVHTWCITPSKFQYYKIIYHGGNGATQTSTLSTDAMWRED